MVDVYLGFDIHALFVDYLRPGVSRASSTSDTFILLLNGEEAIYICILAEIFNLSYKSTLTTENLTIVPKQCRLA